VVAARRAAPLERARDALPARRRDSQQHVLDVRGGRILCRFRVRTPCDGDCFAIDPSAIGPTLHFRRINPPLRTGAKRPMKIGS